MKKYISRFILILLLLVLCFSSASVAHADTAANAFDDTYVLSDLAGAVIDGKTFNKADFPANAKGEQRLLNFSEYSFSTKAEYQRYFGLYLYFYNPAGKQILDHQLNTVQLAVTYSGETPTAYRKFKLKLCSYTADNLFYKFKVEDTVDIFSRVALTPDARRYDLSGIEVFYTGATNAKDCKIGGTWKFSGYAKGCHTSSLDASTLNSVSDELQTAVLDDLQFTYYRTWKSTEWAEQLTSVYFSVDKTLVDQFDSLYSIQAEAYKYLTAPIVCIYDKYIAGTNSLFVNYDKVYGDLYDQRGKVMGGDGAWVGWEQMPIDGVSPYVRYNLDNGRVGLSIDKLAWVKQVSSKSDFTVSSSKLLDYMANYSSTYGKTIQGKYSADLFADKYYSYHANYPTFSSGYLPLDITCDDSFTLVGSSAKATFWQLLFNNWDNDAAQSMSPIETVTSADIARLSNEEIAARYYVAANDVDTFCATVRRNTQANRVTYVFRFDVSDYYTTEVLNLYGIVGYMAQEAAYLDFDIISLGYSKDNVVTYVPAVCSPIDIIAAAEGGNGTATGKDDPINLIKLILMVVSLVLLVLLIFWLAKKIRGLRAK
jgi:hypothetical protein